LPPKTGRPACRRPDRLLPFPTRVSSLTPDTQPAACSVLGWEMVWLIGRVAVGRMWCGRSDVGCCGEGYAALVNGTGSNRDGTVTRSERRLDPLLDHAVPAILRTTPRGRRVRRILRCTGDRVPVDSFQKRVPEDASAQQIGAVHLSCRLHARTVPASLRGERGFQSELFAKPAHAVSSPANTRDHASFGGVARG
jgi:hypothetical protein